MMLRTCSLVNIIAQDARSPVTISSLTPNAGFTMSDGLVLPSPIIMLDGAAFMWDVEPPAEEGFAWEGFNEDKLRIFEACVPRPGEAALLQFKVDTCARL